MTPLQRRTLEYLATVDSATREEIIAGAETYGTYSTGRTMATLLRRGHVRNISETRNRIYRITLEGRQAIAPPLVRVAWKDGRSAPLKPATAEALRVRLDAELGPGTHWVVPT